MSNASVDPSNVFDEIDEAGLAVCATPSIEVFDRVLDDAWAALQGDLAAARRRDGGFSKAEAVELADQMAAEIEQLRRRCAELEEKARAEREGAEQLRRQLSSATERGRAGELSARAADRNQELERVHADPGPERRFGSTERSGCSCACRCT